MISVITWILQGLTRKSTEIDLEDSRAGNLSGILLVKNLFYRKYKQNKCVLFNDSTDFLSNSRN